MKKTYFLSSEEKERGYSNLLKHSVWNGLGFSFLTETIIYLMAINFNATNVQLGYISSALFLSGLTLLVVPHLFVGVRLKSIYFWGWFLRGVVCLAYLLLFFIDGQPAIWLIMITYTLFCVFRTLGLAANQPIIKSMMSTSTEGSKLIQLSLIGNRSSIISRTISFAFLSLSILSGLKGLIFLSLLGVIVNTISSFYILKMPSRERLEKSQGSQGIFLMLKKSLKDRNTRYTLIVLWLFMISGVLNGFIIPFLQREGGIPSNLIFLYSILGMVGGLSANYFIKPYIDKTGSKPLLFLVNLILGLFFLLWAFINPNVGLPVFLIIGLFHSFFVAMGFSLTNRLFFKIIPKDKSRLTFSSMNSFVGAALALITGLSAGKIADYTALHGQFTHTYSLVFILASAVTFLIVLATLFVRDQGSITLKEASELIFLTRNRRAFLWTYQLSATKDPQKRESTLLSLEKSHTHLATRELKNQLNSPYSWEKERIIRSLYAYPRPNLAEMIREEAADPHSYNRLDALFALAKYPGEESEKILHHALEDRDPHVISVALKSLTRLDHEKYAYLPDEIFERIKHSSRAINDWFIACCEIDTQGRHLQKLFSLASPERGYRFQQLIFCLAARYYGKELLLAPYFQTFNSHMEEGIKNLLEELREQHLFLNNEEKILKWIENDRGEEVIKLMQSNLPSVEEGFAHNLKVAIEKITPDMMNKSSYLALIYFSYQILREGA